MLAHVLHYLARVADDFQTGLVGAFAVRLLDRVGRRRSPFAAINVVRTPSSEQLRLPVMTTEDILVGIDRSLKQIAAEREQLLTAKAELLGTTLPTSSQPPARRSPKRPAPRRRGQTLEQVFQALDPDEPRTAAAIEASTGIRRLVVSSTLTRLVKQGRAAKAQRGYLRVDPS